MKYLLGTLVFIFCHHYLLSYFGVYADDCASTLNLYLYRNSSGYERSAGTDRYHKQFNDNYSLGYHCSNGRRQHHCAHHKYPNFHCIFHVNPNHNSGYHRSFN
ncbi:hypothetical protein DM01DRAFT_323295 [Hesseltinella vesiculosa]|uniref:Secreted protein n=1 Tax=Hesseltinella vesiculosa TaxID=101127 RepID=A0A1X2GNA1_9FUNG|nr:hypothetical protein DM01DRAFT_323295 [Hesseltinella vesiculosa]